MEKLYSLKDKFILIKSCHLCRSYENIKTTLHHVDSDNLSFFQKLNRIAQEILENNPNLPNGTCMNCIMELNIAYKFINKCSQSQAILQRYLVQVQNGQQIQPANNREILIKVIKLEETNCNSEVNSNNCLMVKDEKENGFLNEETNEKYNVSDYDNSESNRADFQNDIKVEKEIRYRLANFKNEDIEEICNDSADDIQTGQRGKEVKLENNYSLRPSEELQHVYYEDASKFIKIEDHSDLININNEYEFTEVKDIKTDEDDFENDIDFTGFDLIKCDLTNGYKMKYDLKLQSLQCLNEDIIDIKNEIIDEHLYETEVKLKGEIKLEDHDSINSSIDIPTITEQSHLYGFNSTECSFANDIKVKYNFKLNCLCDDTNKFLIDFQNERNNTSYSKNCKNNVDHLKYVRKALKRSSTRKLRQNSSKDCSDVKVNIRSHTTRAPYICNVDNKARKNQSDITRKIGTGKKSYECKICGKDFSSPSNLTKHIHKHTGKKPFQCKTCKEAFNISGQLTTHILTHTGENPFQCETCKKAFARKGDLMRHNRTHTGKKPFQCKVCKKAINVVSNLNRHVRTHTN